MNLSTKPTLTCTVPSSRGNAPMSCATSRNIVFFSYPFAATTSCNDRMMVSPSIVTLAIGHGFEQQVATVVEAGAAQVVDGPLAEQFHRDQDAA